MKTISPALSLLTLVWQKGAKDSWGRINHSMRNALSLAIGSGLEFQAGDFKSFGEQFRWHYWVSDSTEWIYSNAIVYGNTSCIEAYEDYVKRQPFRANSVSSGYSLCSGGYIHANSTARQRERLAVGFSFPHEGMIWSVTSFDDEKGIVRTATYAKESNKPNRRLALTHDDITEMFPAKKSKKPVTT